MTKLLETLFTSLLDVERLCQSKIGVVDGGISHEERHCDDRRQSVELADPDEDECHASGNH